MFKKKYLIIFGLVILSACKKDPGLVVPTDSYSTTNFPKTLSELNSVLVPCYSNLRDANLFGFHLWPKALSNATHTANSAYDGDPSWNEMAATNLGITNTYVQEAWTSFFAGVKNCNVAIQGADFYMSRYGKPQDQSTVDLVKGQAYFLRAYYYFNLECLFGESYITTAGGGDKKGVPIFTELPTGLEGTQKGRNTVKEVWDLIVSDCKQSAALLKGKTWSGNDKGRISEWAAKSLLGKAYVFTQNWNEARTVLKDVIDNSGKSLMPYEKYRDAFIGISANEFNEESIFELNVDQDSKGNYGVYGNTPNATTINGLIWCPWALGEDGTEGASNPLGYGNEIFHDKNVERFGFGLGSYTLKPNPDFNSGKAASYTNPKNIMDPVYKQQSLQVRVNKTCDPRLFVNALQPWVDSVKFDGRNWYPVSMPKFWAKQANRYGWSFRKYAPIFDNINNTGPADAWNYYLIRLAEVYLLYAEAAKGLNDNTTALAYLNKTKRRAYGYPDNAPSPVDYTSLTGATVAIGDPVLGNNPLYYERFAELFNEGGWWFDVCRWRIGASEAAYYETAINVNGKLEWKDKTYSWPIPQAEFNSNPKMTGQQNQGY
ncbi:RagB/SusD family nutrient uptake outer membrane protein [Niastella sp. OAS944]|uniref:RagB/SusD family nutrient uptake outer membrane protein n=1 Tax=Niastella sp. OAS944 TaxID=2664089 RepID=UPI00346D8C40|nr:hypothetical protein [Chitinophagaceae bacterium OAS944]